MTGLTSVLYQHLEVLLHTNEALARPIAGITSVPILTAGRGEHKYVATRVRY